jgi:hypothetical protein
MGLVTPEEYAALFTSHAGAIDLAHKVNLDLNVGDLRTGLLSPSYTAEAARAKHKGILDGIDLILRTVPGLSRDLQQALKAIGVKHHVSLASLSRANADDDGSMYDPDNPLYEWHRLVVLQKQMWHPGVPGLSNERRAAKQARSIQQSKLFLTLVMHRRATFNEKHSEYVLLQIGRSVERLFREPAHLGAMFKFGLLWTKDHWRTWVMRIAPAGIGVCGMVAGKRDLVTSAIMRHIGEGVRSLRKKFDWRSSPRKSRKSVSSAIVRRIGGSVRSLREKNQLAIIAAKIARIGCCQSRSTRMVPPPLCAPESTSGRECGRPSRRMRSIESRSALASRRASSP